MYIYNTFGVAHVENHTSHLVSVSTDLYSLYMVSEFT